jgi:hypothetical protein
VLVGGGGDDDITRAKLRVDACAGTAHQHQSRLELRDEQGRGHAGKRLAYAGDGYDHILVFQLALVIGNAP